MVLLMEAFPYTGVPIPSSSSGAVDDVSSHPEQIVWISDVPCRAVEWGLLILMKAKSPHRVHPIIDYQAFTTTK